MILKLILAILCGSYTIAVKLLMLAATLFSVFASRLI